MPRDADATRARLVREAERLFARNGVWQVTIKELTESAGQRNPSALHYHFGSREGLLDAILASHGDPIDERRGELLDELGAAPSTRDFIGVLLAAYHDAFATSAGCDYLRIVAQLTTGYDIRDPEGKVPAPNLARIMHRLVEGSGSAAGPLRRQRGNAVVVLMAAAFAERAEALESDIRPELDDGAFLANLADMLVAMLEAPVGPPIPFIGA